MQNNHDGRPHGRVRIPVYAPHFSGREREYVLDCLDSGWISWHGSYVGRFEKACADYIGVPFANCVSNGTVALHVALVALGIGPGDEVIVPTLTYIASVNAIRYVGARPVFCECTPDSWQLDPADVRARITPRTKAIMAVHLYGQPAAMPGLVELARAHNLFVIEDAAEALGSRIGNQHVGSFGDVATFSFFGNKVITTGEGGLVVTRSEALDRELRLLKGQYVSPTVPYWHEKVGFNFRMTNVQAAIGLGQLVDLKWVLARKREIAEFYQGRLSDLPLLHHRETPGTTHNFWMCSILVERAEQRDALRRFLESQGIETRPVFYPVHTMPMYVDDAQRQSFPISQDIAGRGINLPSFPDISDDQLSTICVALHDYYETR